MRADQVAGDVDGFGAGRTASEIGMRLAHGLAVSTGELRFGEAFDRQTEKLAGWLPATDARDCGFFPDFFAAATLPFGFGFECRQTARRSGLLRRDGCAESVADQVDHASRDGRQHFQQDDFCAVQVLFLVCAPYL